MARFLKLKVEIMNQPIEDFKRPNELKSAIPVSDWIQMEMNRSLYLDLE